LDQRHGPSSALAKPGANHANRPSARQPLAKFICFVVKIITEKNRLAANERQARFKACLPSGKSQLSQAFGAPGQAVKYYQR
jgi:hypothetical protein